MWSTTVNSFSYRLGFTPAQKLFQFDLTNLDTKERFYCQIPSVSKAHQMIQMGGFFFNVVGFSPNGNKRLNNSDKNAKLPNLSSPWTTHLVDLESDTPKLKFCYKGFVVQSFSFICSGTVCSQERRQVIRNRLLTRFKDSQLSESSTDLIDLVHEYTFERSVKCFAFCYTNQFIANIDKNQLFVAGQNSDLLAHGLSSGPGEPFTFTFPEQVSFWNIFEKDSTKLKRQSVSDKSLNHIIGKAVYAQSEKIVYFIPAQNFLSNNSRILMFDPIVESHLDPIILGNQQTVSYFSFDNSTQHLIVGTTTGIVYAYLHGKLVKTFFSNHSNQKKRNFPVSWCKLQNGMLYVAHSNLFSQTCFKTRALKFEYSFGNTTVVQNCFVLSPTRILIFAEQVGKKKTEIQLVQFDSCGLVVESIPPFQGLQSGLGDFLILQLSFHRFIFASSNNKKTAFVYDIVYPHSSSSKFHFNCIKKLELESQIICFEKDVNSVFILTRKQLYQYF